ncbi:hypothetical protein Vadar_009617 [Vaccinium darrowii]|uniref:Uncharacterized protein n=1 Tax=Vaccinium darrowii TaxID=229202 RepID=A0ACB7XYS2_9ERIC|nr:hypothetical protein Vadar_009617 [Vaccinium darrowii]
MNLDKDTALHLAVQNEHVKIVRILTKEDREFSYPANKAEETPLYLAVEREDYDMVAVILDNLVSPFCSGPDGRTALHAAALLRKTPEIATKLLIWKPELIDKADANGWTPLHYAARCGNVQLVKKILEENYSLAQVRTGDEDGRKTALHIAAAVGKVVVMKEILSACPECWEMVDCKGHNILHIAADMQRVKVLKFIFKMSWLSQLINQKDNEGNTPLHLLAEFEVKEWEFFMKYRGFSSILNKKNMSPEEVLLSQQYGSHRYRQIINGRNILRNDRDNLAKWKIVRTKRLKEMKKARENLDNEKIKSINEMAKTHVIVATLIATITFTVSFTMPGGYDSNPGSEQGMPILIRKATFKAFVITNTIALLCSFTSAFLYVTASCYIHEYARTARHAIAVILIHIAMVAMMVAFITGSYSMYSNSLGVPIAILGCIFFLIFYVELENAVYTWDPYVILISDPKKKRVSAD